MYTVGQFAKLFGLSRSTLLYYDEIGILSPSARSASNYRLYTDDDIRRMERVRGYREAGLPLEIISGLLRDGSDSLPSTLECQLNKLSQEIARLRHQQHLIGKLLGNAQIMRGSRTLTKEQWVALLASTGMSEEGMRKWHAEFEKNFPEAHQDFLESLGIPTEEVTLIRKYSAANMNPEIVIRSETNGDIDAIAEVTVAAFSTLEISNHTEQYIIEALRAGNALAVSLVAEMGGRVVGHIAFSPVTISDGTPGWYGLGPVSVLPECQRHGIGKALIRAGLARLRNKQARGCCLVGHPEYYRKFGFDNAPGLVLEGVPAEFFFALAFDGRVPQGTVTFHEGFKAEGRTA